VFKGYTRLSRNGGSMQECSVCGLLFLGGGACPTCGSQVAVDIDTEDIVMDDDKIPGLDEIADAIGDEVSGDGSSEVLPFGMGAKAEVIESSLPFGVGSFTSEIEEVSNPDEDNDFDEDEPELSDVSAQSNEVEEESLEEVEVDDDQIIAVIDDVSEVEMDNERISEQVDDLNLLSDEANDSEVSIPESTDSLVSDFSELGEIDSVQPQVVVNDVPDMWRIDAAEVDMDAIYAQEDQVVEISFDEGNDDVHVTFDDFHHSPVEESMASDDDAPELHPAKALAVNSAGQPEVTKMIESAFESMANSSWMQAAQILSTASNNRQNDPAILNNLGLALLQSALEMDSQNDPMSDSQYEASIMALRQGAKIDPQNNTILLNLSHALLVSGRAEKALNVINVLRSRVTGDIEVENAMGACLIQLGRDDEAESILTPYVADSIVSANLELI
tara:strand:+ start:1607 stop:2941 length:1335 start_codon:yes stop_codon:yes gene_type:complete